MEDLATLLVLLTFLTFLVLDTLRPARAQRRIRGWRLLGIAAFVIYVVISTLAPLVWIDVLAEHTLVDASGLGTPAGVVVGLLVVDLAQWVWHYLLHHVDVLWRWSHQVHHSAERIDTAGAFYFSPLDMLGFSFATSFALVFLVGVTVEAALVANTIATMLAIFQHANVRTPVWLGYVIQRPEAHHLHHGRDVHAFNYGSLAFWDLVFGTWRNPVSWRGETGLFEGSTAKLGAALLGRDLVAEHRAGGRLAAREPGRAAELGLG